MPEPGSIFGGYRVISRVGDGVAAENLRTGHRVTLQILPIAADDERRRQLQRAAALAHAGLEEIDGRMVLVSEPVAGEPLSSVMHAGRLPRARVLGLAVSLAEALGAAHVAGVVHGDLRTQDVWVHGRTVKVLGFGVRPVTSEPRDDVLALGRVLREMAPATKTDLDRVVRRCLDDDPRRRYQTAQDVAHDLDELRAAVDVRSPVWRWPLLAVAAAALLAALAVRLSRREDRPSSSGRRLMSITTDAGYEGQPAFTPDGATVVYTSDRSGNLELYLQQLHDGRWVNLTQDPADDVQPAISPDGTQLAYVSTRGSERQLYNGAPGFPRIGGGVWVRPLLGGLPRRVAERGNFPSWSPDGKEILYVREGAHPQLFIVPAIGGEARPIPARLDDGPTYLVAPKISPRGDWILLWGNDAVFVLPAAGGKLRFVASGRSAAWTDGGRAIVLATGESGVRFSLARLRFDPERGSAIGEAQPLMFGPTTATDVAVAPGGRRIAFTAEVFSSNLEVKEVDAEASAFDAPARPWTRGAHEVAFASLSPDGSSAVYESRGHIWRVDAERDPVPLTSDPAFRDDLPRWSPDGVHIAFLRRPAAGSPRPQGETSNLWIMAAEGGAPRQLVAASSQMAWMPDGKSILFHRDRGLYRCLLADGAIETVRESVDAKLHSFEVSPDAAWLAYGSSEGRDDLDLWRLSLVGGGDAQRILSTPRNESHPLFSPSGRWLYFTQDHKNLYRVPGPAQGWASAVPERMTTFAEDSTTYLEDPHLSADGKRLIYARGAITGDLWLLDL